MTASAQSTPSSEGASLLSLNSGRSLLVAFLAVSFAWTYGYDLLTRAFFGPEIPFLAPIPRAWGPPLAAVVVLVLAGGSLRDWVGQVTQWRVSPRWWLFALLFPILWSNVGVVPAILGDATLEVLPMPLWQYVASFLIVALIAGGLEEFGWRGVLQPMLQRRTSALLAAVVVGLIWVAWHLPLFVLFEGLDYQVSNLHVYTVDLVCQAVLLAWIYNRTGGSVLPCVVFHAAGNLPAFLGTSGEVGGVLGFISEHAAIMLLVLAAVAVVAVEGHRHLADESVAVAGLDLPQSSN